jgi:hypothetical protein
MFSGLTGYPFETNLIQDFRDNQLELQGYLDNNSTLKSVSLDYLSAISLDGCEIEFLKPMQLLTNVEENEWIMRNEDLKIISAESDYHECLKSFQEQVIFIHEEYGCADDSELTKDAIKLKKKINMYI